MKKVWMILAALLATPIAASAEGALPFGPGEKLSYEVSLLGLRAGEAELQVDTGTGDAWRFHASGRTVGATDSIFGLRQTASCTADQALQPQTCLFTSKNRGTLKRREVRFDPESGLVRERTLEDGKRKEREHKFADGMADVQEALSGIYLLRRDLPADGQVVKFRAMRKGKPMGVEARRIGEETVETPAGTFACTVVDLQVNMKVDKDAAKHAKVWFTADERRMPVKVSIDAPVGSLEAELTSAQGTIGGVVAGR